jgi:hypothetical protein
MKVPYEALFDVKLDGLSIRKMKSLFSMSSNVTFYENLYKCMHNFPNFLNENFHSNSSAA